MSSERTIEEHLMNEIAKSGYPLEIEVFSMLKDSKNWLPYNQQYYLDYDQNEGRSLDIVSYYVGKYFSEEFIPKTEPFEVRVDLTIECKKSNTYAWVFFTIPEMWRPPFFRGQTLEFLRVLTNAKYSIMDKISDIGRKMDTESFLHYDRVKRIAIEYDEIKLSKKSQDKGRKEIFEAINQIVKYIGYDFGTIKEHMQTSILSRLLCLYFPIIVFDGKIYECIVEKNIPRLLEQKHILLRTHYRPRYSDDALSFGIDVVQREFLPTFLEEVDNDIQLLAERISSRKDELIKFTEESLKAYFPK